MKGPTVTSFAFACLAIGVVAGLAIPAASAASTPTKRRNPVTTKPRATTVKSVWKTYVNERFGFAIDYPANELIAAPESLNGDGRRFDSKDGTFRALVYQRNNVLLESKAELSASAIDGRRTTLKIDTKNGFVVSGTNETGDRIWYIRTRIDAEEIGYLDLEYPATDKLRWDAIVSRMSKSFNLADG